ncbi:MAG: S41 family peptidase [Bacteroidia bacterium]
MIYFNYFTAQECFTKQYDTSDLNKDLVILKKSILQLHPSVGFYENYDFYKQYLDTALQVKNKMTEKEFRIFLKSKLNILHCGHTNIIPSKKYMKALKKKPFKVIPYFITYDNHQLTVVKGIEKKDTLLKPSDTILKIDRTPTDLIIRQMKKYLYTDGLAESAKDEMIQRHFTFYFSGLVEKDSFLLTIKNKQGIQDIWIKTRTYLKVKNELMTRKTDTLFKHPYRRYYNGRFLNTQKSVYYMQIRMFGGILMKHRFRKAFRQLRKHQTDYLIIDLRNNPGGKITQSTNLLSYLLPTNDSLIYQKVIFNIHPKKYIRRKLEYRIIDFFLRLKSQSINKSENTYSDKIHKRNRNKFKGKVYVLANANTFSAANLVAVYLSKRPDTKIVGSEPSGIKWGSNAVSFLRLYLPHTKIMFVIPTYRIIHSVHYTNGNTLLYPIKPDIPTYYHTQDLFLKRDKEMEAVYLDIIKK